MKLSRKCINYSGSTWNFALFSENITPPGKKFCNRRSRRPRQISTLLLLKGTFWAQDICLCSRWALIGEVAIESSSAAFMNFSSFLCFNPPIVCVCWGCNLHGAQRQWHHLLSSRCLRSSFNFPLGDKSPRMITFQRSSNWKISTLIMICEHSFFWVFW